MAVVQDQDGHVLRGVELIDSSATTVFKVLTDITKHYKLFNPNVTSVKILTPGMDFKQGFSWAEARNVLYLRETIIFNVIEYEETQMRYKLCMEDGFNRVLYTFRVHPLSEQSCQVSYEFECHAQYDEANKTFQPSMRLARMMAKQDGILVKRLKAHVESNSLPVQCF